MKIFILLSRIPWPLEKGDKLRAFNQIKHLAVKHEIILCALNTDPKANKQQAFKALQPYCKSINFVDLPGIGIFINLLKVLFTTKPLQAGYFYNARANNRIQKLIQHHQPDLLYGQLLRVAEYIRYDKRPKVIDYQDVFSKGMQRRWRVAPWILKPFFHLEYKRLLRYETIIFDAFDLKTIISEPDRLLIPHPERNKILIVPNGVDHDFFHPMDSEKKYEIVFTGNMAYPPNVNAAEFLVNEIMPIVWQKLPEARVLLAGATPDKKVRALASNKVVVSGWMDDIRLAYAESKVFIAPMHIGTGLQNKLLEAMSMLLPCVTTELANAALKGQQNTDLMVGQTAEELAAYVLQLLMDEGKAKQIAQNGFDYVHAQFDWAASIKQLESELNVLASKKNLILEENISNKIV